MFSEFNDGMKIYKRLHKAELKLMFIKTFNFCVFVNHYSLKIVSTVYTQNLVHVYTKAYSKMSFYFCRRNIYFAVVKKNLRQQFFASDLFG